MATASRTTIQTALLSVQGLRRRRLGHIGPNHYPQNELDKWGRKKTKGATLLAAGGRKIPTPRASLILGGQPRRNVLGAASPMTKGNKLNGSGLNGKNLVCSGAGVSNLSTGDLNGRTSQNGFDPSKEDCKKNSRYSSDLVVVLDMDECLLHSQFLSDRCEKYRQEEDRPSGSAFHHAEEAESIITTTCESFRISLPEGDLVHINKRPNLDLFLKEITSKFETYIFTAAMEVYASPVLNELDPKGEMFCGRFYREHCIYNPDLGVYAKDLCDILRVRKNKINSTAEDGENSDENSKVGETNGLLCDERRVVLVDNNPLSFIPNPSNGILVSSFYDDPKDDTLEAVMELLHELDESDDVRPILDEKFGLKDALMDVVKGTPGWR